MTSTMRGLHMEAFPQIIINNTPYVARRRLMTSNMIFNTYEVWLYRADGEPAEKIIQMDLHERRWCNPVSFQDKTYWFRKKSLFAFKYSLEDTSGKEIAHFSETTPFLTFSVRKTYKLQIYSPVDETLLAFTFFLATAIAY